MGILFSQLKFGLFYFEMSLFIKLYHHKWLKIGSSETLFSNELFFFCSYSMNICHDIQKVRILCLVFE